jgi:hypothetical protein
VLVSGRWLNWMAALLACAVCAACSKQEPVAKPGATAGRTTARAVLGEADSVVGGVKVVLLELRREGADALLVRWEFRNLTDKTVEVLPLSTAGMNAWRLATGTAVQDTAGNKYAVLDAASSSPQAAKHDEFTFAARFEPMQTVETWARVKAPPAAVRRVDVFLPTAAPLRDVPIAD